MVAYEPFVCHLDPDTGCKLKVYLFKNVQNVEEVRRNVVSGAWACAVVKPALVLDPLQLAAAANRAALHYKRQTLVTRTLHAEILYNLSLTKNISQSLTAFGVETEKDFLVCFVCDADDDSDNDIIQQIQGELCPISELTSFTNLDQVKVAYKVRNLKSKIILLDAIISKMMTKNFVSH